MKSKKKVAIFIIISIVLIAFFVGYEVYSMIQSNKIKYPQNLNSYTGKGVFYFRSEIVNKNMLEQILTNDKIKTMTELVCITEDSENVVLSLPNYRVLFFEVMDNKVVFTASYQYNEINEIEGRYLLTYDLTTFSLNMSKISDNEIPMQIYNQVVDRSKIDPNGELKSNIYLFDDEYYFLQNNYLRKLDKNFNEIDTIAIDYITSRFVTLLREDGGWTILQHNDYSVEAIYTDDDFKIIERQTILSQPGYNITCGNFSALITSGEDAYYYSNKELEKLEISFPTLSAMYDNQSGSFLMLTSNQLNIVDENTKKIESTAEFSKPIREYIMGFFCK